MFPNAAVGISGGGMMQPFAFMELLRKHASFRTSSPVHWVTQFMKDDTMRTLSFSVNTSPCTWHVACFRMHGLCSFDPRRATHQIKPPSR